MTIETYECVLCGLTCSGFGNNPEPLADYEDGRCCDDCNSAKVIPARLGHQVPEPQPGPVLRITPDGRVAVLANEYSAISEGVGAAFDYVYVAPTIGLYVGDESLLDGSRFNLVASMVAGRALYGNAVLTHGDADQDGNTQPVTEDVAHYVRNIAKLWRMVVANNNGQDVMPQANAGLVPLPVMTSFDNDEDMFRALGWGDPTDGQHRTEGI